MTRWVDFDPDGESVGRCVVLPGRRYTPDGPMLFFAAQAALAHGWSVRQVWWEVPESDDEDDGTAWVSRQLEGALAGFTGRVLVVAKSLGTLAAPLAAARGYDAAWLTPLLPDAGVAQALTSYPADQFVVIGSEDPLLAPDVLDALPGERLVVPGDHVLRVPGDVTATLAAHVTFVESFDAWLGELRA